MIETIPEMKARYERQIADLQGQIEQLTLDLEMERRARERGETDRATYRGALWEIRHHEGRVCEEHPFSDCGHEACESSYRSWVIADKALAKQATTP